MLLMPTRCISPILCEKEYWARRMKRDNAKELMMAASICDGEKWLFGDQEVCPSEIMNTAAAEILDLHAQVILLTSALHKYGYHRNNCKSRAVNGRITCDCGYIDVLNQIKR